jgi:hypothetical protein
MRGVGHWSGRETVGSRGGVPASSFCGEASVLGFPGGVLSELCGLFRSSW